MADSFNSSLPGEPVAAADVEMIEDQQQQSQHDLPFAEGGPDDDDNHEEADDGKLAPPRVTFAQYLSTPIVTLVIGSGGQETLLSAHQGLLVQSAYLRRRVGSLLMMGPRQIELPGEDIEAMGCFLEFLYTGDYFPKKVPGQRTLEKDPSIPDVDLTGDQLLKHAKVYTLAEKFGLVHLKNLASSKIHCVNSTAKGEIAYARYVYEFTARDDTAIRVPVANFWATRSHTLRAEAEEEFRGLCLEFPQFGYDVLTRVLDEKLKRERNEKMHPGATPASTRKRPRHSSTAV